MDRRREILLGIFGVVAGVVIVVGFAHWRANYVRYREARDAEWALARETYTKYALGTLLPNMKRWIRRSRAEEERRLGQSRAEDEPVFVAADAQESEAVFERAEQAAVERIAESHGMTADELRALWARTVDRPFGRARSGRIGD